MSISVKVGRNMLFNGIAKASVLVGNLVVLSIYSHYLGSVQFGIIALMNTVTAFYWLFFLGVPQTLIKQISHHLALNQKEAVDQVFTNGTLAILSLGSAICIILTFVAPLIIQTAINGYNGKQDNLQFIAYITVISTFLYTLYTPIDSALQGFQCYGTIAFRSILSTAFGWFLMVVAVWLNLGIRGVAFATLGQPLGILITNFLAFRKLGLHFQPVRKVNWAILRYQFAFGFPLFINDALATIRTRIDIFILGLFWSAQYVGYYSAAMVLALYTLLIPRLFVGSLLVSISELNAQGDFYRIRRGCILATRYLIIIVTPLVAGLAGFSYILLITLFPTDFGQAWPVLVLLAISFWAEAISYPCTAVLIGINAPRHLTWNTGGTLVALGILLFTLVPPLGPLGAALANTVIIVPHLLLFWQVAHTLSQRGHRTRLGEVFPFKSSFKVLGASLSAVALAGALFFEIQPLLAKIFTGASFRLGFLGIGGIIGSLVYWSSLILVLHEIGPEDWLLLSRIGKVQQLTSRFKRKNERLTHAGIISSEPRK